MSGLKLYEISNEYQLAIDLALEYAEEHEGELPEWWDKEIENVQDTLDQKRINCALAYKNIEAEAEAIKNEAKRLTARAKSISNYGDRLKQYIRQNTPEGQKIDEDPRVKLSWRKSTSTIIDDVNALPKIFQKIEISAYATEIKKAIQAGGTVPGAHLQENLNLIIS